MWLIKQFNQKLQLYNFSKHQKIYFQSQFFIKLLLCLLLVGNCFGFDTGDCSGSGYCYFGHGEVTIHSGAPTGVIAGKTYKKDDLVKGKINILPKDMDISDKFPKSLAMVYAESSDTALQKVNRRNVYEYISNHADGSKAMGKDSTIYFGLTPAQAGNNYYLATFDYKGSNAVYISFNELSNTLAGSTLKSIVICSNLISKPNNGSALYIKGESTITLTAGLIIAKGANIKATNPQLGYGLDLQCSNLKADIINYGEITVKHGKAVRIDKDHNGGPFGLLPPNTADKTAKFNNYGKITMEDPGDTHAFYIRGDKRTEVDTFEITNQEAGKIIGRIQREGSIFCNLVNAGKVTIPAADKAINIDTYEGKGLGELIVEFGANFGKLKETTTIINLKKSISISPKSKIVIAKAKDVEIDKSKTQKINLINIEADNKIASEDIDRVLYSQVFKDKNNEEFFIAPKSNISKVGNKFVANFKIKPKAPDLVPSVRQFLAKKLTPAAIKASTLTPAKKFTKASTLTAAEIKASKLTPAEIKASTLTAAEIKASKLTPADKLVEYLTFNTQQDSEHYYQKLAKEIEGDTTIQKVVLQYGKKINKKGRSIRTIKIDPSNIFITGIPNTDHRHSNITKLSARQITYEYISNIKKTDEDGKYNLSNSNLYLGLSAYVNTETSSTELVLFNYIATDNTPVFEFN